jgi:hypothetical protein
MSTIFFNEIPTHGLLIYLVLLFFNIAFLVEWWNLDLKILFDNRKNKYKCYLNKYDVTLSMWSYVLLHQMDQMQDD